MSSRIVPPSRREVWKMFNRIAERYDLLNHLLSLNRDTTWRQCVADLLPPGDKLKVLDLATGTADQLLTLYDSGRVDSGTGVDLAEKMLAVGNEKIRRRKLADQLELQTCDAEKLPFEDGSYDVVTIAFGIRNMTDVDCTLAEMYRVLKPNGRALILEFSLPTNQLIRSLYVFYLRYVLPRLGGMFSGDRSAYSYLDETVETFPCGETFCNLMKRARFSNVHAHPLTFGIATIYRGDK